MARKRAEPTQRSWKLPIAAGLVGLAALVLYLVIDGHIYRATQGAEIGLYVTIGMLALGFCLAGSACLLALQVVARPRRPLDNVIKLARDSDKNAA
jgi:hypothetical protein